MRQRIQIPMPVRYLINGALVVLLFLLGQFLIANNIISSYFQKILLQVGIYIIAAVSLNVATGYLGQLPLGHAGFMAVGGYTAGIFMKSIPLTGLPAFVLAIILAGIVAGIFGVIIGIPALRLKGDYLAIITLGFGEIIRVVLLNIDSVLGFKFTGGAAGLMGIPKYTSFPVVFICVAVTCLFIHTMMKSRHGRAILAIRENEIAAEACGIHTTYYKTMAFVASAFFAGVSGALFASYLGLLVPGDFGFMKSIEILVMVVLGGMGSMLGSVLAATVLTIVPFALQSISQTVADYRMVIYSVLLIVVMIFKPSGLLGTYDFSLTRIIEGLINRAGIHDGVARKGEKSK
ncbi:MAG: branched-chain amino acid ABC transporter permease [Oscillospiraceae bacterium]|nr:branched-chain amino acid ABC transporter permease [Oscillospiraceae bacterium]